RRALPLRHAIPPGEVGQERARAPAALRLPVRVRSEASMNLWPAIDVRDGRCVRLVQGDFDRETIYGDPIEVAQAYVLAGAERLHVVDLDAAMTGLPINREVIGEIAGRAGVPIQVGG